MKKLLLFLALVSISQLSIATHSQGGEISWECLNDGRYVFKYVFFTDLSQSARNTETMYLTGNPLPRDSNNNALSSIILSLIPNSFSNSRLVPQCHIDSNQRLSDNNLKYIYKSAPIRLLGTPPVSGWNFIVAQSCCRNTTNNLLSNGSAIIRSTLFMNAGSNCLDNSPVFSQNPELFLYRDTAYNLNEGVIDFDGDSLSYSLGYTYNGPYNSPQQIQIQGGTATNPFNVPLIYDSTNGNIEYRDTATNPGMNRYHLVRKVDSYRGVQKISSTYREYIFISWDTYFFSKRNNNPMVLPPFLKGNNVFSFKDTVLAGDFININLNVRDTNLINGVPQEIRVQVISDAIAKDYTFNGVCTNPRDTNCASISSANAIYNAQRDGYEIVRTGIYNGQIRWQTDCSDLSSSGGPRTHYFVVRVQDDLCPIPGLAYETIEVTVLPPTITPCPLITSSREELSIKDKLSIYPNPTNGQINIQSDLEGELNLKVFNIQGQLVQEEVLLDANNQIQLQGEKGLYFISITNQKGEQANFKVVKQ